MSGKDTYLSLDNLQYPWTVYHVHVPPYQNLHMKVLTTVKIMSRRKILPQEKADIDCLSNIAASAQADEPSF